MPRTKPDHETVADESQLQTGTPDETIADVVTAIHAAPANEIQAAYEARLAELNAELAALDTQDPIVYRYNSNASDGERLIGVPLSDLRQSVWDELPKWSKQAVTKSYLYTKVEA